MTEVVFAIPGDLGSPTGGYAYARHLVKTLPGQGIRVRHLGLPAAYPDPAPEDLAETARLLGDTPPGSVLLIDGLAYGGMPRELISGLRRPIVALVHHPLGLESGLPPARQAELIASETQALGIADHVIVTSRATGKLLAETFGVPSAKTSVAEPGTDRAPRSQGTGKPVRLIAVGTISPRKGYDILLEALRRVPDLDWELAIVGATDRVPGAAAALERSIRSAGFEERVTLAGAVDRPVLEEFYRRADLFVSASLFEGYGMALAEALARGLPIVAATGGAAAETVPDQAALKVSPGDSPGLGEALRQMIADQGLRRRCADAAWAAGQRLPGWVDTARHVAGALRRVRP